MKKGRVPKQVQARIKDALAKGISVLPEDKAKDIFALADIPMVHEIRLTREDKVIPACRDTGFPVVLKAICPGLSHKTEAGLVHVGLGNEEEVRDALGRMKDRVLKVKSAQDSGKNKISAFLVQPVVRGKREFLAGIFRDPQFGPVIVFGLGGILTEALKDVVFKLAPLKSADIKDMFSRIAATSLLGSFRGEKAVNKKVMEKILVALSDLAVACPDIKEIDINPVMVQPDGSPVAVDGLIVLEKSRPVPVRPAVDLNILRACYYPKSVAFVGASATHGKWGHMLLTNTFSRDFKGRVYLVNPKGGIIAGRKVYNAVGDIDDTIDLAVVTIPAGRVMALIPELEKKKTKGILLITSGFRETGEKGAVLEEEVTAAAAKAGIMILGPNTMGICNPHARFYCTAAHAYPEPGSTTMVCQSGTMGTQLLTFAEQQDIGIRAFSGSGNEAMVTIEDYMDAFEVDDLTKTVVLYIESIKDGPRFFNSARRVSGRKPIVVLKGGRTRAGLAAAASHTGALSSDNAVFDAACRQAGIIRVDQPVELLDVSAAFSSLPLPIGKRVAIMTFGGGWGVIAADLCAEQGLEVPDLSPDIIRILDRILPPFWSRGNPIDIVGEADPEIPKTCLEELMKWDGCDAVIHLGIHGMRVLINNMIDSACRVEPDLTDDQARLLRQKAARGERDYIRCVGQLIKTYEKPVIGVSLLTDDTSKTLYRLEDNAYKAVFFPSPERAVKALWGMVQYTRWQQDNHDA